MRTILLKKLQEAKHLLVRVILKLLKNLLITKNIKNTLQLKPESYLGLAKNLAKKGDI